MTNDRLEDDLKSSRLSRLKSISSQSERVDQKKKNLKFKYFIDGSIGSICGKLVTAPADRLKILIQTQHPEFKNKGFWRKNDGLLSGFRLILAKEGTKGLYKSNSIALVRHGCHGGTGFLIHDTLHVYSKENQLILLNHFSIGALSGIGATMITHPIDSFRTQVAGKIDKNSSLKSYWNSLSGNSSQKVIRLYKGLTAGLVGVAPYAALNFGLRDTFADILYHYPHTRERFFVNKTPKWHGSFLLGWMAGCCTQLITYPLEILKRRKQISPTKSYADIVRCANEGSIPKSFRMLYRGFSLNIIRHPFCNGIVWFVRDAMNKWSYV